ncbi:hypothetical protein GFL38_05795 [Rhizobium leguminosarum bv. viciae]|uniref:hypothetical protein n=1 Tax=Rhizobium ruizarguesonis TaxID=2081791 RepID=UPI00143F839F|nr:hypothetical protein [Rhizobium ruizarguesonis]NKJ71805.1 hypothetical protein [Rhizobium leguminosarum bv. viciae]NKQ77760.1 hypothetical protein [Rhizobium ruizarguesonis]
MAVKPADIEELIENLAAIEHERWAHWQSYVHSSAERQSDGSLVIPRKLVEHWERQIETSYHKLSDEEKKTDREQVMKYLPYIERWLSSKQETI